MAKHEQNAGPQGEGLSKALGEQRSSATLSSPARQHALSKAILGRVILGAGANVVPNVAADVARAGLARLGLSRMASRLVPCLLVLLLTWFISPPASAQQATPPADTALQIQKSLQPLWYRNEQLERRLREQQEVVSKLEAQLNRSAADLEGRVTRSDQQLELLRKQTTTISGKTAKQETRLASVEGSTTDINVHVDRFWLLIAGGLVFFMQAGFLCLEVGMVRPQHGNSLAMKTVLTWMIVSVAFFLFGFAFMFGDTLNGLLGASLFAPTMTSMEAANPKFGIEFFMFQLAFAGTSAVIVSGAVAERTAIVPYMLIALFAGGFIYPLIGHWAWGTEFHLDPQNGTASGWLKKLGFVDFAGSTVVHSVGAWMSLWAIRQVGARRGRFREDGTPNDDLFPPYSLGYATLGVFVLWLGWWGFNGGSQLRYDLSVSSIVLNTNISAAVGGLVAFLHAMVFDRNRSYLKLLGGVLGGLVAITANCNQVTSLEAIAIGAVAGVIHNYAFDWLLKRKLDDPVGAIPVHGACGVWGTLAVALFGDSLTMSRFAQLGVQVLGIVVVFVVVSAASYAFFLLLNQLGMRVTAHEERHGFMVGSQERSVTLPPRTPELSRALLVSEK